MTITLWTETTVAQILGLSKTPGHQLYARQSTADLYRDGGFDIALYQSDPNIEVDLCFTPARDRDGWGTSGVNMALEESAMFRDHDFLDAATLNAAYAQTKPGVFIFNSWVEAWGTHTWFPCEADDAQAQTLAFMSGEAERASSASIPRIPRTASGGIPLRITRRCPPANISWNTTPMRWRNSTPAESRAEGCSLNR